MTSPSRPYAGHFITFEGPEGAGKSTQLRLLAPWLEQQGFEVVVTREPGGTAVGDRIRGVLFAPEDANILGLTEAFLMNAARAQHVRELLQPALQAGKVVLCDRYADATLAYQGYARGLDLAVLRQLIAIATDGLAPNLTVYLDVPVEIGLARKRRGHGDGEELNYLDRMSAQFHQRLAQGYKALIAEEPGRWQVVDATASPDDVQQAIRRLVVEALPSPR
ncbi:MAG: dTMP kinase [Chloroflexota bacterium]|nr:dTMP kinase [Chloroflexota bacterium]